MNCGKQIDDDRVLCEECEAAQNSFDEAPVNEVSEDSGFVLNTAGEVSGKAKKSPVVKIVAIVAAVAVVVGGVLWAFWDDLFGLKFDTPEERMAYVESQSAKGLVDDITGVYGSVFGKKENVKPGGYNTEIHIKLGDEAMDMISSYADVDLEFLSDIMLKLDASSNSDLSRALLTLGLGKTGVVSMDCIMDIEEYVMYIGIPELSKTYFEIDLEEIMERYYGSVPQYGADAVQYASMLDMETLSEIAEFLPSEQVLNKLLKKYIDIAFDEIAEVESESETIEVDGISQKCTALTVTVDQETLINMCIAVLEEAKSDKQLIDVILNIANSEYVDADLDSDDIVEAFEDALSEVEDALDDLEDNEELFELTDYVDSDHNIIGRSLELANSGEEIYYLTATNNGKFAFEASFADMCEITGSGTNKKGVINGEYSVEVQGEEYLIVEVENFNSSKWKSGNASGTVRLIPSGELLSQMIGLNMDLDVALELVMDTSDTKSHVEINALMNDELLVGIIIDSTTKSASKISVPSKTVDPMDEDDVMDWASGLDFDTILDNLNKAGVPDDYLDLIEDGIEEIEDSIG